MATKKTKSAPAVASQTLAIQSGKPTRTRAQRGVYLATLQSLEPNSEKFFLVEQRQQQSVRQIGYKNGILVHIEADLDKNKPTGKFRVFRVQ